MSTARGAVLDVFGVSVRLDFDDGMPAELVAQVEELWSAATVRGLVGGAAGADGSDADVSIRIREEDDLAVFFQALSSRVTLEALRKRAGELLLFHAAGIAADHGGVTAFVAPSGHGKTTLSRALAREYGYVSDETIAVRDDLEVLPYRKPLSVKHDDPDLPKEQISPAKLRLRDLPDQPLHLERLVVFERDAALASPEAERIGLHEALVPLVSQMSYLSRMERPLQRLAALCSEVGGVLRLTYAEAEELHAFLPELAHTPPYREEWTAVDAPRESPADRGLDEQCLTIGGIVDAIRTSDATIVLADDGIVRVLGGIGPDLWDAARDARTPAETTALLIERYGRPEEQSAEDSMWAALQPLLDAGMIALA